MVDFASALSSARRQARLSGRPLSQQETAGIGQAFANTAAAQAAQRLELKTEAQQIAETRKLQKEQAERVESEQALATKGGTIGSIAGGIIGGIFGGPGGAAAGAQVGGDIGGANPDATIRTHRNLRGGRAEAGLTDKAKEEIGSPSIGGEDLIVSDPVGKVEEVLFGSPCIIVTACTSHDSPEVNLTREYRDTFMTPTQITGYYYMASKIVPVIKRSGFVKRLVKRILVDRLIDHGQKALGYKDSHKYKTSYFVASKFMGLCNFMGCLKMELSKEALNNG